MFRSICIILAIVCFFVSCAEDKKGGGGPIVLGDSTTIVTETDSTYLTDYVDDIQLRVAPKDTVAAASPDTGTAGTASSGTQPVAAAPAAQAPAARVEGLNIPFKEVTVLIPGIKTRSYRTQDPARSNGVTYELTEGDLAGNELQVSGATISRVSQRYITEVLAATEQGTLELDALSSTSAWTTLRGKGNTYPITGLRDPEAKKASASQIRSAVSRAARNRRMSRQAIRKWEQSVRNVRSVNQRPLKVVLRAVMWKVDGKDAAGKPFQKQIRIDIPAK